MCPKTRRYSVLTAVVLVALLASYPTAAPKYSDWSAPVNLGAVVNSPFNDQGPAISKDGLSLYFSSGRPGFGGSDIWVSQRDSLEAPWGPPNNLNYLGGVVNTTADESIPALSRDEHWLFFNSPRWTSENRPFPDTAKPAISGVAIETSGVLLRGLLGAQVGLDLRAPAARSALEHVRVMEQPIEQCRHRGGVAEQLSPVVDGSI
jgi:hypothetical protein